MSGQRRLFRTRRARQDLIEIWEHVAADNPAAADALLDRIDDACSRLIDHPRLGPARDDIRPGLRYLVVGDYLVLYRIIDEGIEIVRVVHGRRDLFNL
jgi:toxin ParE1/3/4